ncbi:MAG: phospho-N-acetylmuramoyl-pentapeptide-transferase [Candidatus Hydrothermota bacterium]|nr:MAG: phospho-N-acetylmuramoyl-pentapeptide-transferase [Candidatus Hydrothermae bacterium]
MLYHLLYPLRDIFFGFNVFRYITFRAAYAAVVGFIVTVWLVPKIIKWSERHALKERISEDVPERHRVKEGTPSSGGLAFIAGVTIAVVLFAKLTNPFIWVALGTTIYLGIMGFIDDKIKLMGHKKRGMSKRWKLILQSVLALAVFAFIFLKYPEGVKFNGEIVDARTVIHSLFFKRVWINLSFFYPIFLLFVFVGTTNAVNLTDGLDGLAAGAALSPIAAFTIVAYVEGHVKIAHYLHVLFIPGIGELSVFGAAFFGALLGFLWYNCHPAEIFMGDTGSQALGGALAIMAILTKQEVLLAIAGGLFVIEAVSVIIQVIYFRRTGGKRFFLRAPIHHHFELKGWPEPKIVVRFWLISLIFALFAISTLKVR